MVPTSVYIRQPGQVAYAAALQEMQSFNEARTATTPDEIWLLEHPAVYTLGINAADSHLIDVRDTPVVRTDRGGQVTWHGPGQLVVYTLLDLQRKKIGVRDLVCTLEQSIILMLKNYGISAAGREGAPGVYTKGAKIASIGLRIRKHCSYHGISVNVNPDLEAFSRINTCGYEGLEVTRTCDHGGPAKVSELAEAFLPILMEQLELIKLTD